MPKLMFKKNTLNSIENSSLKETLKDPWPKLFKYFDKSVKILNFKKNKLSKSINL